MIILAAVLFVITNFISCKKEKESIELPKSESVSTANPVTQTNDFTLLTPLIDIDEIISISQQLLNETRELITDSFEIEQINIPLINNGRLIHQELLVHVKNSSEWSLLTDNEKLRIEFLTDYQYAEISLIYSIALVEESVNHIQVLTSASTIKDCISAALGLGELYYLVVENPKGLLNAKGATKILKHVGLRYLGYIGLALALWHFVNCYTELAN